MTDAHVAHGACCVYKITHIASGKAYIGKTVWPLEKYIKRGLTKRKKGIIGNALRKYGREAFHSEILLVGSEAFCFRDIIDGKRGGMERRLIAAYGTVRPGGYNLTTGGDGWTSEDMRRWHKTPEGREVATREGRGGGLARLTGYPQRRVLAELEKGPRSIASLAASLGLTKRQVEGSFGTLRFNGHHIIGERGGIYRLVTLEEAANDWASGRALSNDDLVLGLLMEGPRTLDELIEASGAPRNSVYCSLWRLRLRKNGYNIESRRSTNRPSGHGTFHMIQDERHPWMHLHEIDLRGAALDDRE